MIVLTLVIAKYPKMVEAIIRITLAKAESKHANSTEIKLITTRIQISFQSCFIAVTVLLNDPLALAVAPA